MDRQTAAELLDNLIGMVSDTQGNDYDTALKMGIEALNADAIEVVRCKDCKYMTEHYDADGNAPYWTCSEWDSGTDYDGFCHYAERRTDE